jgi:hypothetical protein
MLLQNSRNYEIEYLPINGVPIINKEVKKYVIPSFKGACFASSSLKLCIF